MYTKEVIEHIKKSFMKPADAGNGNDQNKPPAAKIDAVDTSKGAYLFLSSCTLFYTSLRKKEQQAKTFFHTLFRGTAF